MLSDSGVEFDLLTDELSKLLCGLRRLQPAVEVDSRLDTAVSKQPPYRLVVSRPVLEIDRRCGVSKLMRRDPNAYRFHDPFGNQLAERDCGLRPTALAREQPGRVRSAKQRGPVLMNIFVDEICQGLIELEVEIDTVLHVIMRKNQPVRLVQATRFDEVFVQLDAD